MVSEALFPLPDRGLRLRLAALAAIAGLLFAAGSAWLALSFVGLVGRDVPVTVRVTTLGDSLGVNSGVKFRGLRVGRVLTLDHAVDGGSYTAHVVIERQYAGQVPASVVARVLPGTIFGADFVDLVEPRSSGGGAAPARAIRAGAVIGPDTSAPTIRLMDTFSATQRVLGAIDPASMDQALSQLAAALDGRGEDIAGFVTRANRLLGEAGRAEPALYADLDLIADSLRTTADVEPALARTLRDSLPIARTIAAKAAGTERLLDSSTRLTGDMAVFLRDHGAELGAMLDAVMPTYRAFVGGIGPFETILRMAVTVLDNGAKAVKIKDGAIQMRAQFLVDLMNPYSPADCPRYGSLKGSNCR